MKARELAVGVGSISAIEIGSMDKLSSLGWVTFPLSSVLHYFDNLISAKNMWLDGVL